MRTNGTLQYCVPSEGGFNEDGEPIAAGSASYSEDIPCLIRVVTNNSKGRYEDGKFNQASYEVLVESANLPLNVARVRLYRAGIMLGEFAIQGVPTPTSMGRVKIMM